MIWTGRLAALLLFSSSGAFVFGCSSDPSSRSAPTISGPTEPRDAGASTVDDLSSSDGGVAVQGTFRNPVREGTADPWMFVHDGYYYLTYTRVDRITIVKARSLLDLATAPETTVWTDPTPSRCCNIWAPEVHRIGDRFYIHYTADDGDIANHRQYVLESAGTDPLGPYSFKAKLATQEFFAIDGTVVTMPDKSLYFVWSGVPNQLPRYQNLYIAKMKSPWELETAPALLSQPTQPWEIGPPDDIFRVNEGPEPLYHDGKTFIVFSASGCATPDYSLGMLTYKGGDPLEQASWQKSEEPLFARSDANRVFGPGHNSFFSSPDGKETWNGYHAIHYEKGSCGGDRSLRVQKVEWRADGTPDFGMPAAPTTSLPLPSGDPGPMKLVKGRYRITLRNTELSMALEGCSSSVSTPNVALGPYGSRACEQWEIEPLDDGSYKITSSADGRALTVPGCSASDHGDVATEAYSGQPCEAWFIDQQGPAHWRISAKHTGYPLEIDACDAAPGTDVNTWREYRLEPCQQWRLDPVP